MGDALAIIHDLKSRVTSLEIRMAQRHSPARPAKRIEPATQALLEYWNTLQHTDPEMVEINAISEWLRTTKKSRPGAAGRLQVTTKGNQS